ncbi:MAG TPA: HEAT repeat domain-containing protein, partial [Myxococcaceae bacterium]
MSDERPEALLKSALEKIIYFEARSQQLCTDLQQGRDESERLRRELSAAAQREISLRAQVAELEVTVARSALDREEQVRLNEALRRERKELIGKLIDASRLHATGEEVAGEPEFDLASFIAELRGEALGLREVPGQVVPGLALGLREAAAQGSMLAPAPGGREVVAQAPALVAVRAAGKSMTRHAERFRAEGRLDVSAEELYELARVPLVEETLFGFSVRELSAPEPGARIRAAERLRSLATPAAAPALASALNAEQEPRVLVSMLEAFAPVSGPEGAGVVSPHLRSTSADVRISALRTLLRLDPAQAAPHLSAAMKDPDRTVRRRASLLALGLDGEEAQALGEEAGRDQDPKVRALGALALGAAGGTRARDALTALLQDADATVRQAASRSLSRILGTDVSKVVAL